MGRRAALAGLLTIGLFAAVVAQEPGLKLPAELLGPMVGAVTSTEATIWAYPEVASAVTVKYRPLTIPPGKFVSQKADPDPAAHNVIKAKLTGLSPTTIYQYEIELNGKTDPVWMGQFKTAGAEGQAGRFSLAFSSCMNVKDFPIQSAWYLMLAEKPDFQLILGDNVYANTTDREKLWSFHTQQRRVPEFAAVIRNTPTYAMWDDHDYGPNNSDGTAKGKENSLVAFKELFANPGAGLPSAPGAFYRFSRGDVDFFVLDGRYYRSPDKAPNDDQKRMLGDAQFAWLADGLKASKARFKVLASGSTFSTSTEDGWSLYNFERQRLLRLIMDNKISGVVYLSGDIHRSKIDVHPKAETGGYPLVEVISSGIANSATQSFVTLEFDTTLPDPTMAVKIIHGDATVRTQRLFKLSDMMVK